MVITVIRQVTRTPAGPRLIGIAPHLAALADGTVSRSPRAEAIADLGTGRRLRYADLWDEAIRVAGGLLAAGTGPGDRVAIRLPNGADYWQALRHPEFASLDVSGAGQLLVRGPPHRPHQPRRRERLQHRGRTGAEPSSRRGRGGGHRRTRSDDGSKVGAVVVPRAGKTVAPLDLVRIAREELADFKVPQYLLVRDDALPRNPGGKVDKAALRAQPGWGAALW